MHFFHAKSDYFIHILAKKCITQERKFEKTQNYNAPKYS